MVFKPDFSFNPRPVTPRTTISRPCSPKASIDRKPYKVEGGEVSPSSKGVSIMSSSPWSSKRSSMTSIASLKKQYSHNSPLAFGDELIASPAVTLIEEDDEFSEYSDEGVGVIVKIEKIEKMRIKEQGPLSINTKTSIFKGFHPFQFHSSKKRDDTPPSPVIPVARTPISPIPLTPNTRATAHSRFRLFKSAPKRNKSVSRRPPPPPLTLQAPKVSPPFSIRRVNEPIPSLEPAIVLDTSMLAPEEYDFSLSPEAGVQLLSQTLEEDCDEELQEKEEIYRSYSYQHEETTHREAPHLEEITPIYLASPWFDASRGASPMHKTTEVGTTATKFPQTYLPMPKNIFESIPASPVFSPLAPNDSITRSVPEYKKVLESSDQAAQPQSPHFTASPLHDEEDDGMSSDIEDSPALVYTRESSVSNSRKSSIATFFCRGGQSLMQVRNDSIGFGGLTGDEIKILDDAESIYYPGIDSLKVKTSWLYNSPTGDYSSDEDDSDSDSDYDAEEIYPGKSLPITPMHRKPSITSSLTSTPELMLSSASSVSSYGQMLSTPPSRIDRRRTASSDCMMLEALEEMEAAGLKHQSEENSKGLGLFEDFNVSSEWADALWEMDADEQVADWNMAITPQVALIGVAR